MSSPPVSWSGTGAVPFRWRDAVVVADDDNRLRSQVGSGAEARSVAEEAVDIVRVLDGDRDLVGN